MGKDEFLEAARQNNLSALEKFLQSKARKSGPFTSLRRGPGANIQDGSGFTALHHAAVNGHRDAVSLLLRYEASVNIQDNKGSTALHLAAWGGHLDVVRAITQQGPSLPNINHQNNGGETALHCASQYGHIEVVKLLLSQKADPTLPSLKAETPLDLASQFGHLNVVELLIGEARLDLLRPYSAEAATAAVFPHTPLHLASRNGHLGVVKVLIKHGHNVNVRTSRGSPLHEAAICGKVEVVRMLMEAGADPGVRNDVGKTVLDTIAEINTPVTKQILGIIKSMHTILIAFDDDDEVNSSLESDLRSSLRSKGSSGQSCGVSLKGSDSSCTRSISPSAHSSSGRSSPPNSPAPCGLPLCASMSPPDFGGIYENVLVPTLLHPTNLTQADEPLVRRTIGRRNKAKSASNSYRHSDVAFRPASRERRHSERENRPPDPNLSERNFDRGVDSRLSDRESRFSDRDSCGKLSDREGRLSDLDDRTSMVSRLSENASDNSYIYDVPPPARLSIHKDKTVNMEEGGRALPHIGAPLRHHKWKSECSPLHQNNSRAVPPPKPPRRSICPPSPNYGRISHVHNSCYETIFFSHSNKKSARRQTTSGHYRQSYGAASKSDNELLDEPNPKRMSMPIRTASVDHSVKNIRTYSSDSDSDSSQRLYSNCGQVKKYSAAKFRPVKAERTTKRNMYENVTPPAPPPAPALPPKKLGRCLIVKSRSNNSDAFKVSDEQLDASATSRSRLNFSTFSAQNTRPPHDDQTPETLSLQSFYSKNAQPPTPEHSPPSAQEAFLSIRRQLRSVDKTQPQEADQGLSCPVPSSPEIQRTDAVSSGCSSPGASLSSVSTDNIEEIKSEIPFAGLYRGSRVPDEWTEEMSAKDSNFASTANTFRSLDKGCTSQTLVNHNNVNNNNNEHSSVLSPLDEAEEWARINDIMSSFGGGLARESVFMAELEKEFQQRLGLSFSPSQSATPLSHGQSTDIPKHDSVGSWLRSVDLGQYDAPFMSNGFDNLHYLNGIIDVQDLKDVGVSKESDVEILMKGVECLPRMPSAGVNGYELPKTVKEWLSSIHLAQYFDTFVKHGFADMERVRKIWEVELSVVLEISRSGHRKRMLMSLGDRPIEPQLPPSMTPQHLGQELMKLNTDICELKRKLFKELPETSGRLRRPPESNTNTVKRSNTKRRAAPPPPPPRKLGASKSAKNVLPPAEDIALRNPCELAADPLMSQVRAWKHAPTKLLSSSLRYVAEYLGSTHVKELKGTESTISSIQKLKRSSADCADIPKIVLSVSYFGVQFINTQSENVVCEHEIRNIHCASQDRQDMTHFAYITKDVQADSHYCHVFRVSSEDLASEIVMTIAQAFEVAFQIALKAQTTQHTPAHTRSISQHMRVKPKLPSHNRSQSNVVQGGASAPNTSMENLLSDSGTFSDKESRSESATGSPHAVSNGN